MRTSSTASRTGTVLLFTLLSTFSASAEELAYWPLDTLENGACADDGPHGLHAALRGQAPENLTRTGAFGEAVFFDNGSHWLEAAPNPALDLQDDFTISCAILPYSVDGFRTILWKGDRTRTPEAISYYLDLRDGKVELKAKDAEGRWTVHSTSKVVSAGAWHALLVTYRAGTVKIWVNGKPHPVNKGENGRLGAKLLPNDAPLVIGTGANSQGIAYGFSGLIDEVRITRGASTGPSQQDLAAWADAVATYEERKGDARARAVRKRVEEVPQAGLPATDLTLLENLKTLCDEASRTDAAALGEVLGKVEQELDRLAFRRFYRNRPDSEDSFLAVPLRTCDRLVKSPRFFEKIKTIAPEMALESTRNEYEGFQVAVVPAPGRPIEKLSISLSPLTGPGGAELPATAWEWGWVRPIETEPPDIPVEFTGWIPDAIIEGSPPPRIAAYDFECLYFRVYVPADTAPGQYTGSLTLDTGDGRKELPVRLMVHDFTLPEKTPLKMAFSFFEHFYREWYGLKTVPVERQRELYRFLLKYRIAPNNIYNHEETYPSIQHLKEYASTLNFFTYDAGLPHPGTATPEAAIQTADRIAAVHKRLAEAGLLEHAYVYCFDELMYHTDRIPQAKRFTDALRERIPDIRIMQTSFPKDSIRDLFNVWCPIVHHFDRPEERKLLERLKKQGQEIWWYVADAPRHPFPNLFLDYPVYDARIYGLLSFMYDVEGMLYWSINREWTTNADAEPRWPEGEWKAHIYHAHTGVRKRKNGMGNLIYPGPEGRLYPSLRLENLRDGVEDHAYMVLLQAVAEGPSGAARARDARRLLDRHTAVATAASDYDPDPSKLLEYRREVAEFLDGASGE